MSCQPLAGLTLPQHPGHNSDSRVARLREEAACTFDPQPSAPDPKPWPATPNLKPQHQVAYAERVFLDKFWPEVSEEDLDQILEDYGARDRRYGT